MSHDPGARRETPLSKLIKARIRRDGPITVQDYMRLCLHDPEHGYYARQPAIGAAGDFVTAPEISQVFGELIGLWAAVVWQQMGRPIPIRLVELGPGRGTLMKDALRALGLVPDFLAAVSVDLLESNEALRAEQRQALAPWSQKITWHRQLATLPRGATIAIANEFLDALPVLQMVKRDGRWLTRNVGLDDNQAFVFTTGEGCPVPPPPALDEAAEDGAVFEHPSGAIEFIHELRSRMDGGPLALLAIDYGHVETQLGDTLQGVRRHRHVSPFETPGETDLTTDVDFAALARLAAVFARIGGPVTQAEFLGRLGIVERASRLMSANPDRAGAIEGGVARLLAPHGMGTRFQVMGLRSAGLPPLPGFASIG